MEIKVNEILKSAPVQNTNHVQETVGNFMFILASNIEEAGFQEKVVALMNEISEQGKKLSKRTDVRDMRK